MMHCSNVKSTNIFEVQSEYIGLRPAQQEDIEYIINCEKNPQNSPYVSNWSKEEHLSTINSTTGKEFIIHDLQSNAPVGFMIILNVGTADNNILLKRFVITEKNKGLGRKTLDLLKKWAFETIKAHRLWLDVKEFNYRAKHLYESSGFVVEGKMRESQKEKDGSYSSFYILSILEKEYSAAKN